MATHAELGPIAVPAPAPTPDFDGYAVAHALSIGDPYPDLCAFPGRSDDDLPYRLTEAEDSTCEAAGLASSREKV